MRWLVVVLSLISARAFATHALGLEIHASSTVGPKIAADLALPWVRVDLDWDTAQPSNTTPDFTIADGAVNAATTAGQKVLLVIANTPAWASSADLDPSTHRNDVPTAGTYSAFVSAAVTHFHAKVSAYELWSEPNLPLFWEGTAQSYIDVILKPGADALRAACAGCTVVAGALSSNSGTAYDTWLDAMLTQASDKIDVVSGHIYVGFPEDDPAIGTTSDSFLQKLEAHRAGSPLSFKEVMDAHAFTKGFWLTATGFDAQLGTTSATDAQTRYYRHVLEKAATRSWWSATFLYEAVDAAPTYFGVAIDGGGVMYTKKPVFDFMKLAAGGQAFGGVLGPCADGLDNDGDGLVDFPADPDCLGPDGPSEGNPILTDGGFDAGAFDLAPPGVDGSMSISTTGGGNGGGDRSITNGCALGTVPGEVPFALVAVTLLALVGARRRA